MTEALIERRIFPGKRFINGLSRLIWRAKPHQESAAQPKLNSVHIIDRPEHLDMFPARGGVHVPGVPRYDSGFRNWYDVNSK